MATRTPYSHTHQSSYDDDYDDDDHPSTRLFPGERIGQPLAGTRLRTFARRLTVIAIAYGGGWLMLGDQSGWPGWVRNEATALYAEISRRVSEPADQGGPVLVPTSATVSAGSALEPIKPEPSPPPTNSTAAGDAVPRPAAAPVITATLPPAAASADEAPLPPPKIDRTDPNQVRAVAVGLHPELSRVLLARLTATDYRNAGIAIKTALAETPDTAVYVWPREPKADLARFKVHFVPGAVDKCRRYVVTVSKDGWLTTAMPMEKCKS